MDVARKLEEKKRELAGLEDEIKTTTGTHPNEKRQMGTRRIESRLGPIRDNKRQSEQQDDVRHSENKRNRLSLDQTEEDEEAERAARLKRTERLTNRSGETKRNKRMFGGLIATLQVARKQTKAVSKKAEAKTKEVETKLKQEREVMSLKRKELFNSRREAQIEIEKLAIELTTKELTPQWDLHNEKLTKFILTQTVPRIYFLPTKHNKATEQLLDASAKETSDISSARRERFEKDVARRLEGIKQREERTAPNNSNDTTTNNNNNDDNNDNNNDDDDDNNNTTNNTTNDNDDKMDSEDKEDTTNNDNTTSSTDTAVADDESDDKK